MKRSKEELNALSTMNYLHGLCRTGIKITDKDLEKRYDYFMPDGQGTTPEGAIWMLNNGWFPEPAFVMYFEFNDYNKIDHRGPKECQGYYSQLGNFLEISMVYRFFTKDKNLLNDYRAAMNTALSTCRHKYITKRYYLRDHSSPINNRWENKYICSECSCDKVDIELYANSQKVKVKILV